MKRGLPPQQKRLLANGKRPCRGCQGELPKGRHVWCSNACMERAYMALSTFARRRVRERDHGVCALCDGDTEKVKRILRWLRHRGAGAWTTHANVLDAKHAHDLIVRAWGRHPSTWGWDEGRTWWEADHIVPLVNGGTNDLSNYRTLCIPCHRRVTAELARSRSKRGRQTEMTL